MEIPDPVDAFLCSPAHDEETASEEERSNHHGHQARFRKHLVVVGNNAVAVVGLTPEVDSRCKSDSHDNGEEGNRPDYFVPMSHLLKVDWEGCDCSGV